MGMFIVCGSFLLVQIVFVKAGCGGYHDLPVQINPGNTHTNVGRVTYFAPDVNSLANQLKQDIPSLTQDYANVLAQDAFYIEENMEITYRFIIATGNAHLSQFKIVSTTLGDKKVNIQWNIIKAYVTYTAQRNVKIHRNRRRRRWIGGGRRRCTWKKVSRGLTQQDISKIQGTLHSTMNSISSRSSVFVKERVINMKSRKSHGTCAAWKRVINISLVRSCVKRAGAVPRAFTKAVNPSIKRTIQPVRTLVRKMIRPGMRKPKFEEHPYLMREHH